MPQGSGRRHIGAHRIMQLVHASTLALLVPVAVFATEANASEYAQETAPNPASTSNERLFFAVFDCSWENARIGPTGPTNARQLHDQLKALEKKTGDWVHSAYVETDCAHDNWFTSPDGGKLVLEERLEQMRQLLARQTALWIEQTPLASISVVSIGGSWGATQAAAFTRLIHGQGIRIKLAGSKFASGQDDRSTPVFATYRPSQAVVLLDPVGATTSSDLHLPPSVLTGLQIVAEDEKRPLFRSIPIIADGLSEDRRLLGVTVGGSHSDICGGYKLNGFAIRTFNLVVHFINRLSEIPLLHELPVPDDPAMNVVHNSMQERI